jgi:hypothetical protein
MGNTIGLVRGLDEELAHLPDVVALEIVGFGAHQFGCVQFHNVFLVLLCFFALRAAN